MARLATWPASVALSRCSAPSSADVSIIAKGSPALTSSLTSAGRLVIVPEIWAATSTVWIGCTVPTAVTLTVISPMPAVTVA